jgi:hypothetical protein
LVQRDEIENGRQIGIETHVDAATVEPGHCPHETHYLHAGLPLHPNGRQRVAETQSDCATVEPGQCGRETHAPHAGLTHQKTVASRKVKPILILRPSSPAIAVLKPNLQVPGSPSSERRIAP